MLVYNAETRMECYELIRKCDVQSGIDVLLTCFSYTRKIDYTKAG